MFNEIACRLSDPLYILHWASLIMISDGEAISATEAVMGWHIAV